MPTEDSNTISWMETMLALKSYFWFNPLFAVYTIHVQCITYVKSVYLLSSHDLPMQLFGSHSIPTLCFVNAALCQRFILHISAAVCQHFVLSALKYVDTSFCQGCSMSKFLFHLKLSMDNLLKDFQDWCVWSLIFSLSNQTKCCVSANLLTK